MAFSVKMFDWFSISLAMKGYGWCLYTSQTTYTKEPADGSKSGQCKVLGLLPMSFIINLCCDYSAGFALFNLFDRIESLLTL